MRVCCKQRIDPNHYIATSSSQQVTGGTGTTWQNFEIQTRNGADENRNAAQAEARTHFAQTLQNRDWIVFAVRPCVFARLAAGFPKRL